ncbi:hypothetical protein M3Y99_01798600 [Aphelenchoides fujianensis]|nr:hypothetical protein M3Y99_01798600 [Aphelenchoides fujianensis]
MASKSVGALLLVVFFSVSNGLQFTSRRQRATAQPAGGFKTRGSMDDEFRMAEILPNMHTSRINVSFDELFEKYSTAKLHPQKDVEHIEDIRVIVPNTPKSATDEKFAKMVALLKRIAPNVDTVSLTGNHMFKPTNENRPEVIKEEMLYVRSFLKQMIAAFSKQNVRVETFRYVVGIVVPDKIRKQVDFARLIHETFGYQPSQEEVDSKTVGMVLNIDGTPCFLGVGLNPSQKEDGFTTPTEIIPAGRSDFVSQAKLTNFRADWFSKVLDLIQTKPSAVLARHRVNDLSRKFFFSTAADDKKVRATGRTSDMPRRLFASEERMDFMDFSHVPQLELEDFFDTHIDSIRSEATLERLGLRVMVQNKTGAQLERLYETAVENLRKLAPNLREVNLFGGYVFNPTKPTRETVNKEIELVGQHLRQWISAFEKQNVSVADVRFIAHLVVPAKVRESSGYVQTLKRVFNYQPTESEIEHHAVRMRLEFQGVACRVGLHFSDFAAGDDQEFCLPMDRTERLPLIYYSCPEKRNSQQWYTSVWKDATFNW